MENSLFLAKVIGLCFSIFGISLVIAKSRYQAMVKDFVNHPASLLLGGTINLIISILIIVSHNIWQADWRVIITIIGWLLLIRGIIWTTFPQIFIKDASKIAESAIALYISGIIIFILGMTLCYFGFFA